MGLLVLAHVNAGQRIGVVEEFGRQGFGQFRFSHACHAQKQERPQGFVGILQAGTGSTNGIRHRLHWFFLAHQTSMQGSLELL